MSGRFGKGAVLVGLGLQHGCGGSSTGFLVFAWLGIRLYEDEPSGYTV